MPTGTSALPGSSSVFRQLLGAQNCRRPRSGGFQPPTDASIFIFYVRAQPRRRRITFEFMPTGTSALPGSSSVFRPLHGFQNRRRPRSGGFQPPTDASICIFHVRVQPRCFRIRFEFMPTGTSALVCPAWATTSNMKRSNRKERQRTVEKRKAPRVTGGLKEARIKGTTVGIRTDFEAGGGR